MEGRLSCRWCLTEDVMEDRTCTAIIMNHRRLIPLCLVLFFPVGGELLSRHQWHEARSESATGVDLVCHDAGICVAGFMFGVGGDTYILRSTDAGLSCTEVYRDVRTLSLTHVPLRIGACEFAGFKHDHLLGRQQPRSAIFGCRTDVDKA